jgi:hypothetical protein
MRGVLYSVFLARLLSTNPCRAADLYPKIHEIILEAEADSAGMLVLPDKSRPIEYAASLLARAGYIDDAKKAGASPVRLVRAWTLYGDADGAYRAAMAEADPERRTNSLQNIVDILWRMGRIEQARTILNAARDASKTIADPSHRKLRAQGIEQLSGLLLEEPPERLSQEPKPKTRSVRGSTVPPFPVTTDGFRKRDPKTIADDAKQNAEFMTQIYTLVAAGNRQGLLNLAESAKSSFQKMLAWASLEHLFIQLGVPVEAEGYARLIVEDGADCTLAKVEALAAAGSTWGRRKEPQQAARCFDDALHLAATVGRDLAFGRATVVARVAGAEVDAGLTPQASAAFDLALDLTRLVPLRPKPVNRVYPANALDNNFQDNVYRTIFETACTAHDTATARKAQKALHESSGISANGTIVTDWIDAGNADEAIAYARGLQDRAERVSALLNIADRWLDAAGAPVF